MNPMLIEDVYRLRDAFAVKFGQGPTHLGLTVADEERVKLMDGITADDQNYINANGIRTWIQAKRGCKLFNLYVMFDSSSLRVGTIRQKLEIGELAS